MIELSQMAGLLAAPVILVEGVRAWSRGGPRQLLWPGFERGWEVDAAVRLAAAPWIALFLVSLARLVLLLMEELEGGVGLMGEVWLWLPSAGLAALIAPLVHRRSRRMALLSLGLLAGLWALLARYEAPPVLLALGLVFLLWALNGLRATLVDASIG